jgi:hypothetical protein
MNDEEYGHFVFDNDDYIPPFEPVLTLKEIRSPSPSPSNPPSNLPKPKTRFKRRVLFECHGIQLYTQTPTPMQWYPLSSFSNWRHTWNSFMSLLTVIYKYPYSLSRRFSQ